MHIIVKKEIQVILVLAIFYDPTKRCPDSSFFKHILDGHHATSAILEGGKIESLYLYTTKNAD